MRFFTLLIALVVADEDIILQPTQPDTSLPARLLVFIPGANVPNENYRVTAQAIQDAATALRLTVVIPTVFTRKCIIQCPSSGACLPLKGRVDEAVAKANFSGTNPGEDTFVAGHSMGSICANSLVKGYGYEFAGLLAFGGYVDKEGPSSLTNYPIPVLHLSGELDGGGARPGKLSLFYSQFKGHVDEHGQEAALALKPVHVLPGVDHSDFCPGFFVTAIKDLKSEVSQQEALESIGRGASAFLHLNSPTSDATKSKAMTVMRDMLGFTEEMCEPYLKAFEIERSGSVCMEAQQVVSGLSSAHTELLKVVVSATPFDQFEHAHTSYNQSSDGIDVSIISSFEEASGFGPTDVHGASKSVDCKMLDATRIAEQLNVTTQEGIACGELTQRMVSQAQELLPQRSLQRFVAQGRSVCTVADRTVFGNVGPLFVQGSLSTTETEDCLEVSALALVTGINSLIFPGNHYCKLLSPSLALEWMMTDGIKPFPYDLAGPVETGVWTV